MYQIFTHIIVVFNSIIIIISCSSNNNGIKWMKTSIINPYLIYKQQSKYQSGYYEVIASVLTEIFQIAHIKNTGNHGFLEYCSIGPKPECSKTVPEASAKKDADSHWMWPQHKIPLQFSTLGAWYFFLFILVSELQPDFHTRATRCVEQLFKRHSFYAPYFFDQCSDTKTGVHWHCLYCCPRTHLYTHS